MQENTVRVSYNAVYTWLRNFADTCTLDQLNALDDLVVEAKKSVREKQAHSQEALEAANAAARSKGYASLEDLLRHAKPELSGAFMPIRDWKAALTRFTIQFEDRMSNL